MPDFPIVDAHVHLWDPDYFRIPWLDGIPLLNQRYGLAEYAEHTRGVDVAALVYLQVDVDPVYALLEARHIADLARQDARIEGIVPWAPLEFGDRARTFLAALKEVSPLIKGVRRILQGEADPAYCLRPDFVRGVQILPEYGFSFDICINYHQLASSIELVRRCPNTSFILDHIAKPDIKAGLLDPWREQIRRLAELPNVVCKVSGMATEADQGNWSVEDLAPFAMHVIESFGEDRVVFGGDWPVVCLASPYTRWVAALDTITAHLSPEAKRKLWADNARKFYRLG